MATTQPKEYMQGHHRAVTANHATRTAEVEGAFVLPHLKPDFKILDVGCGPGTITVGFAKYVPQGSVTGIDLTEQVLEQANEHLSQSDSKPTNVTFSLGNLLEGLSFADGTFDVVFASQVLPHIHDPVTALKEMKRVCKPGGFIAARDGDMPFRWYPYLTGLQLFQKYFYWLIIGDISPNKEHPDNPPYVEGHRSGSLVHVWARKAGFDPEKIEKAGSVQVHGTLEKRRAAAEIMIGRIEKAGHREKLMGVGATKEEVDTIVGDFRKWAEDVDGWAAIMHCETIAWN